MRVTKYEHATLVLRQDDAALVIDPGSFTKPLTDLAGLVGVVLTHEHADHWTPDHLARITAEFPSVPLFAPEGVVRAAEHFSITRVSPGDTVTAGPFRLEFFGGLHEVIHSSIPIVDNVGVMVNDLLYYPGDSYAVPAGRRVPLLAAPVGAPWLRIGDAIDFVLAVAPERAFATHDMTLSAAGLNMGRDRLAWATEQGGGSFERLDPGSSTQV